jgi:hypothetical protein
MPGQLSPKHNTATKSILMPFDCSFSATDDEDMRFKKSKYTNCVKRSFYRPVS